MTTQLATAMQRVQGIELVKHSSEEIFNQFSELYELIARRAFEIFEGRGGSPGHDTEDWFRAESELLHPVLLNVAESNDEYIVRAEVPGFCSEDIEISVEPRRLVISGRRDTREQEKNGQLIRSEWRASRILRALDLPSDVDTSEVRTTLKDGILTVDLRKAQDPD
jgi:HSP20 family molecular chaperone IbpA